MMRINRRLITKLLFAALMSCMLGMANAATKSADMLYSEGITSLEKGDYRNG